MKASQRFRLNRLAAELVTPARFWGSSIPNAAWLVIHATKAK